MSDTPVSIISRGSENLPSVSLNSMDSPVLTKDKTNLPWLIACVVLVAAIVAIVIWLCVSQGKNGASPGPLFNCTNNADCMHNGVCNLNSKLCDCTPGWTGDKCQNVSMPASLLSSGSCAAVPKRCASEDDCVTCGTSVEFLCTAVAKGDTTSGLEGNYCLPAKPTDNCITKTTDSDKAVPGIYLWQGWANTEAQKWNCTCEYPAYYSPAIGFVEEGACKKNSQLCKHGNWKFPCIPNPLFPDKCKELTADEQQSLVTSSPLMNGRCVCDNVPCVTGNDCANGKCDESGMCSGQRPSLNPVTGLPECVVDTCAPDGKWVGDMTPPYTYGSCKCNTGAVDVGYGCHDNKPPPTPPAHTCVNNCNGNGRCVADGVCVCNSGWSGKTCDLFACSEDCTAQSRGQCVAGTGGNLAACQCPSATIYTPSLMSPSGFECKSVVTCFPAPSVNALTGVIENSTNFSNNDNTDCVPGDSEKLKALCVSSACLQQQTIPYVVNCKPGDLFDGLEGNVCYKNVDCSTNPCGAIYCKNITDPVVSQVSSSSNHGECVDPGLEDVRSQCRSRSSVDNDGNTTTFDLYRNSNGDYYCADMTARPVIRLLQVPEATASEGIRGVLCVDATPDQKKMDGYDLILEWTLLQSGIELESGMLLLKPAASVECTGYVYTFEAFFAQGGAAASVAAASPEIDLVIFGWPVSRWTCPLPDSVFSECNILYFTKYPVVLTLVASTTDYCNALEPTLDPDTALALSKGLIDPDWVASVLKALGDSGGGVVKPYDPSAPILSLAGVLIDSVVQVACVATYCLKASDGAPGSKLIVCAWRPGSVLDVTSCKNKDCTNTDIPSEVWYTLTRQGAVGEPVVLIKANDALMVTDSTGGIIFYYVDILGCNEMWTYALGAYLARKGDLPDFTYAQAQCKSRLLRFNVLVDGYTSAFCATVPAPDLIEKLPPQMWLDPSTGMCEWNNSVPAKDAYCSGLTSNLFNPSKLSLMTDGKSNCGNVGQSYPLVTKEWSTETCDPTIGTDVCLLGVNQIRTAECNQSLTVGGSGSLDGNGFSNRLNALYEFYNRYHSNLDPMATNVEKIESAESIQALYNTYYHCDLNTNNQWGTAGGNSKCDINDAGCADAYARSVACGSINVCNDWIKLGSETSGVSQFQQDRQCFPSTSQGLNCCNNGGTYVHDIKSSKCDCGATSYYGNYCEKDLCEGVECNGQGKCGYVKNSDGVGGIVKCKCNDGYYNYDTRLSHYDPQVPATQAIPDLFQCNQNPCPAATPECNGYKQSTTLQIGKCNLGPGVCVCNEGYFCDKSRGLCNYRYPGNTDSGDCGDVLPVEARLLKCVNVDHTCSEVIAGKGDPGTYPMSDQLECDSDCKSGYLCETDSTGKRSCKFVAGGYGTGVKYSTSEECLNDESQKCGWTLYGCNPETRACELRPQGQWEKDTQCKCLFDEIPMDQITKLAGYDQDTATYFPEITSQPGPPFTSHTWIFYYQNVRGSWVDIIVNTILVIKFTFKPQILPYAYVFIERLNPYVDMYINDMYYSKDYSSDHPYILYQLTNVESDNVLLNIQGTTTQGPMFVIHMIGYSNRDKLTVEDAYDYFCPNTQCTIK